MSDVSQPNHASRAVARRAPKHRKVDSAALNSTESLAKPPDASSTEHIVHAVTRAIVEHRLTPGTKLVEQRLGDLFGVSRTVVRQALQRLSELRLVTLEPARGAFVASPTLKEAREVFAVRRMIESEMLRQLVHVASPDELHQLKQNVMLKAENIAHMDVPHRTQFLFDFHVQLARLLRNDVLTDMLQDLISRCAVISLMYQSAEDAMHSHTEHLAILDAIETKDANQAVTLLCQHLATIEQQLTRLPA